MGGELQSEIAETVTAALGDEPSDDLVLQEAGPADSEEGGVSSSGSAPQADQPRLARTRERIVWDEPGSSGAPPASTSPVRGAGRGGTTSSQAATGSSTLVGTHGCVYRLGETNTCLCFSFAA